jgi:drug/metabolite transporter (DMT)-like permease
LSGPLQLVTSSILFGLMAFLTKLVAVHVPGPQVAFFRFLIGLFAITPVVALRWVPARFGRLDLLALRGLFGGIAVLCYFTAIQHLDVSIATLLNFCSPVFTALFAMIFLREQVGWGLAAALAITLCGVTLITRAHAPPGSWGFTRWHLVGATSAAASGAALTAVRGLRLERIGAAAIFTAFCAVGALCTAPPAFLHFAPPTPMQWLLVGAVAALAMAGQLLMNHALGTVSAAISGTIYQLTPVTTLVLGALFLREPVNALAVVGAMLTLGGVWWATRLA